MVYVYLTDGFEEIEALAPVDVLRRGEVPVRLVSLTGKRLVTGVHDVRVEADCLFEETSMEEAEMIVLPGGLPGTERLKQHAGLLEGLRTRAESGKLIAAICAAPTVLGQEGLLKGRKSTVYPGLQDQLTGAEYSSDIVVEDGTLITSQGPGTALEFGLALLLKLRGAAAAAEVRARMLAERQ